MKRVARKTFLKHLTWVCEQAKFHGFYVQLSLCHIDITSGDTFHVTPKCFGKRHEFIFDRKVTKTKKAVRA